MPEGRFKKTLSIVYKGKLVYVGIIHELETDEYLKQKEQAELNLKKIIGERDARITRLETQINELVRDIKILKGEE